MAGRVSTLQIPILLLLTVIPASSQDAGTTRNTAPARVVLLKQFSPIHRFEVLSGDPAKDGLYVIRIHAETGFIIMPHFHPEDENIVVVVGSWAAGMGEHFNRQALETMETGAYALLPKKMPHFAWSKTDTILYVHGQGPFTPQYVVPNYDLNENGTFRRTSPTEPGRPMAAPQGCFALKLGASVRGSRGDGVVVAAQCTPGELTQYRIEKKNGEHYWAQPDELTEQ